MGADNALIDFKRGKDSNRAIPQSLDTSDGWGKIALHMEKATGNAKLGFSSDRGRRDGEFGMGRGGGGEKKQRPWKERKKERKKKKRGEKKQKERKRFSCLQALFPDIIKIFFEKLGNKYCHIELGIRVTAIQEGMLNFKLIFKKNCFHQDHR